MKKSLLAAVLGAALVSGASAQSLLITEIYINSVDETFGDSDETTEFVEITNVGASTVSLDNVYIADVVNGTGDVYWKLSAADGSVGTVTTGGSGDFALRFPAGNSLAPGESAVVVNGALNYSTREAFSLPATRVFEAASTDPAVPDMIKVGAATSTLSFTNGGECMVLFTWDQASDLVVDLDIVNWGSPSGTNPFTPRTVASAVDGPDGDTTATAYAADGAISAGFTVAAEGSSNQRSNATETGEAATGGNGVGGQNELTETFASTFTSAAPTPGTSFASSVADWTMY